MLELKHIIKKYDDKVILNDISLAVEDGEIISILGPSGGGKTTLLNVILGITPISSGQIVYDGNDLTHVPMQKREFNALSDTEKKARREQVRKIFVEAGADYTIQDSTELPTILEQIENQ